ncbi:DUF2490 domain-containing protein [Chryseobacterium sp. 5_R23647]|uniref:DUF2490 domain-containing protein n=1 Tax=Chryseobacterium sp. 5_R23647 TaxID=2258964 RepID=UPI0014026056|nr:DUF2490 domain-containing protein [Chryseobacterium sp. 5_R23647]
MKRFLIIFTVCFFAVNLSAQISPPGLGHAKTASWLAAGVKQKLSKNWESMSYFGMGRTGETSLNPIEKPSILVLNQEFYKQLKNNWKYSFAVSFRNQKEKNTADNNIVDQQEIRLYGRLSHVFKSSKLKVTPTFRQEFRKFFAPKSLEDAESFALRSRLRLQLSIDLNEDASKKIILSSEQLFSTEKDAVSKEWSDWKYHESRFLAYYSVTPKNSAVTFDIGYMNNLVGGSHPYDVSYLAFDVVFNGKRKN